MLGILTILVSCSFITVKFLIYLAYYVYIVSHTIGYYLVTAGYFFLLSVSGIALKIYSLLEIIIGDFNYFLGDIFGNIQHCLSILNHVASTIYESLIKSVIGTYIGLETIFSTIGLCVSGIVSAVGAVFNTIQSAVIFFKRLVILFGSGVWFALTIVPLFLMYICTISTYYVGNVIQETLEITIKSYKNVIQIICDIKDFVTDVPLESLIGLIVAFCILYACLQFYLEIINYFRLYLTTISRFLYQKLLTFKRNVVLLKNKVWKPAKKNVIVVERDEIGRRELNIREEINGILDLRYCIVCQERIKCVLSLPCRHVCLCSECDTQLRLLNSNCPICRRQVDKTLKVFI